MKDSVKNLLRAIDSEGDFILRKEAIDDPKLNAGWDKVQAAIDALIAEQPTQPVRRVEAEAPPVTSTEKKLGAAVKRSSAEHDQ